MILLQFWQLIFVIFQFFFIYQSYIKHPHQRESYIFWLQYKLSFSILIQRSIAAVLSSNRRGYSGIFFFFCSYTPLVPVNFIYRLLLLLLLFIKSIFHNMYVLSMYTHTFIYVVCVQVYPWLACWKFIVSRFVPTRWWFTLSTK